VNYDTALPLILEPSELENNLGQSDIKIVDLCKADTYLQTHIPGAIYLDYTKIVRAEKPIMGLLPTNDVISDILSSLGISPNTHVIAYDDEGGGKACRFLWTLAVIGHNQYSLLNGGLHAWANEGHTVDNLTVTTEATSYELSSNVNSNEVSVDSNYIMENLQNDLISIIDCRSPKEYSGEMINAARGGHIPKAVNIDWTLAMDIEKNYRLKSENELETMLNDLNITQDKEVIVYCHSHHRSALTFIMLKSLGYEKVKGYPGSWSDWGNNSALQVEK